MKERFNTYNRRARLYPGLILTLPISFLPIVFLTSKPFWWSAVALLLSISGITYLGTQLVRSLGKSKEQELWNSWGGPPTTQMLRIVGATNPIQVKRWHRKLENIFSDEYVPTEADERANPVQADASYETLISALIARTRGKNDFPLLYAENCEYGFRRNLYGCKYIGFVLATASLILVILLAFLVFLDIVRVTIISLGIVGFLDLTIIGLLIKVVTSQWVQEVAKSYASRLIEALETLEI